MQSKEFELRIPANAREGNSKQDRPKHAMPNHLQKQNPKSVLSDQDTYLSA
jgi:hypothetical protein